MPWRRDLRDGIALVRPLLAVRKSVCEDFCRAAGVSWREDPSNTDPGALRARLRRDVLGVFEELWPGSATRACHTAGVVAAARAALEHQVQEAFGDARTRVWDRAALRGLPAAVIAAGLRRAGVDAAPAIADDLGQVNLLAVAEAIADQDGRPRAFSWPGGLRVLVAARRVVLERASEDQRAQP